jgi:hypothetical protein
MLQKTLVRGDEAKLIAAETVRHRVFAASPHSFNLATEATTIPCKSLEASLRGGHVGTHLGMDLSLEKHP